VSANTISSSSSKAGDGCTSSPVVFAGEGFSPNIFLRGAVPGTGDAAGGAGERPADGAWCQLLPHFAQRTLRPDGLKEAASTG